MRKLVFALLLLLVMVQLVLAQSPIGCRNGSYWCGRSYYNVRPYPPVQSWYGSHYGYGGVWDGVAATAAGAAISVVAGEATRRLDEAAVNRMEQRQQKELVPRYKFKDCKNFVSEDQKTVVLACLSEEGKWVPILEKKQ